MVEVEDLSQDAEGRVVHDDRPLPVLLLLIVPARIEGPDEVLPVQPVLLLHPCRDGLIDQVRRVAVVGRLLDLELVQEGVVLLVVLLAAVVVSLALLKPGARDLVQVEAQAGHVVGLQLLQLQRQQLRVPR